MTITAFGPCAWQPISTAPPDESTIVRWHRIWKCEVSVQRNNGRVPGYPEWITATKDQTWPEDAFLPYWRRPLAAPPAAETAATLTGYVLVPAEPTAGTATALKAALKAAADYSPNGVPEVKQRANMVTQAIRAYIRCASENAEAAAKLSGLLEDIAGEMVRAHDVLGLFVREHSDPGTDAMASLWCMGRLLRKAREAGLLLKDTAGRSTAAPERERFLELVLNIACKWGVAAPCWDGAVAVGLRDWIHAGCNGPLPEAVHETLTVIDPELATALASKDPRHAD
ncbi:hypothetical protein ABMY26_00090 (plasmid) [Azospirillum sp. HJ39]|uniref:hypothetical protein n=1 Tax=Azospirillum sp. HJ39 TaxID=3159496 RepID=UPI003558F114